jgi:small subunit ribosomal protein S16
VSVRIRMKQFGRKHRPYFRICAMDIRRPRDGRVLEQLGTYDPLVPETDARAVLNGERIAYWLSVGAQPSDKVQTLIKKYGADGTHLAAQRVALDRLAQSRRRPEPLPPGPKAEKPPKPAEEEAERPAKGRRASAVEQVKAEAAAAEETKT